MSLLASLLCSLLVVACAPRRLRVEGITFHRGAGEVGVPLNEFSPEDRQIAAEVTFGGVTVPTVLRFEWYLEFPDRLVQAAAVRITPDQPRALFTIRSDRGAWPVGSYRLQVRSDVGEVVGKESFRVVRRLP